MERPHAKSAAFWPRASSGRLKDRFEVLNLVKRICQFACGDMLLNAFYPGLYPVDIAVALLKAGDLLRQHLHPLLEGGDQIKSGARLRELCVNCRTRSDQRRV